MKKLWLLFLPLLILGCSKIERVIEKDGLKVVEFENNSSYNLEKIYVKDKRGFTHEILIVTPRNVNYGVSMLELSVYKDGRIKETN